MEELLDTNGPPWRPSGVGAGGRKLKYMYNTVSIFSISHLINASGFTCSGSMECD